MQGLIDFGRRLTGLDIEYFAKGGFWMILLQAYIMVTGLLLSILFARLLEKVAFGQYQFIIAIISALAITALPGLHPAIMQEVTKGNEGSLNKAVSLRLKTSMFGSVALVAVAAYFLLARKDSLFAFVFLVSAVFFPFISITSALSSFLNAKEFFSSSFFFQTFDRTVLVVALIVALLTKLPAPLIGLVYVGSVALSNLVLLAYFRLKIKINSSIGAIAKNGFQLTLIQSGTKLLMQADKLIISYLLGLSDLAVYTISLLIPDTADAFVNTLNSVAFAKLSKTDKPSLWSKLKRGWLVFAFVGGVVLLFFMLPFLIPLVFGEKYVDSVIPSQFYVLILPALFVFRLCGSWLLARNRNKTYAWYVNSYHAIAIAALAITAFFTNSIVAIIISRVVITYVFAVITILRLRS